MNLFTDILFLSIVFQKIPIFSGILLLQPKLIFKLFLNYTNFRDISKSHSIKNLTPAPAIRSKIPKTTPETIKMTETKIVIE